VPDVAVDDERPPLHAGADGVAGAALDVERAPAHAAAERVHAPHVTAHAHPRGALPVHGEEVAEPSPRPAGPHGQLPDLARREIGESWRTRLGRFYPAVALVEVKGLVDSGAVVEMEATAAIPTEAGGRA